MNDEDNKRRDQWCTDPKNCTSPFSFFKRCSLGCGRSWVSFHPLGPVAGPMDSAVPGPCQYGVPDLKKSAAFTVHRSPFTVLVF
eukprot:5472423-Prymnesium_polylepis.1